jgi:hypothetical protein
MHESLFFFTLVGLNHEEKIRVIDNSGGVVGFNERAGDAE